MLARADGVEQRAAVGQQFAGRVGFFLEVTDFDAVRDRMRAPASSSRATLDPSSEIRTRLQPGGAIAVGGRVTLVPDPR